ncbi:MAG: ThiF family adenylyltransferase [Proteobacteria bacterium]|nr:ThiF family adenylyltransferase [Desulfobulbaceae bacterium]MBU4152365.1 ThiF family adenylyltransferase [Pseudomonadota bacterium]
MDGFLTAKFRLRPSVSFVPMPDDGKYQFFLSDIRQSFIMAFRDEVLVKVLASLDGSKTLLQLVEEYSLGAGQKEGLARLFEILIERCAIEDFDAVSARETHPFRRVINFIASYIPYHAVGAAFDKFTQSQVVIVGAGGVGSWVALLLAQMGVKRFVIIDDDVVKPHNLNRSVFTKSDVGTNKAHAIANLLSAKKQNYYECISILKKINSAEALSSDLEGILDPQTIFINCADYPSVAQTSAIINEIAFAKNLPYIIAGGYNMHLSLIGPTIIPGEAPCFHCISHGMNKLKVVEIEGAECVVKEHRNLGNLAPLAAISASFAANEGLKLMLRLPNLKPTMIGKRGEFNFFTNNLTLEEYEMWDECHYCSLNNSLRG